jgi:TRAP-type C4-dicarboxylate transport system permease small subunit
MMQPLSRLLRLAERLLNVLGAALVAVILISVCTQIVMRYALDNATTWSDPVAASALAWLTFMATASAVRSDTNMSVRFTWKWFSPRGVMIAETASQLLTAAFAICLSISAWQLMQVTDTSEVEGLPFRVSWAQMYSITLVAGAFMVTFAIERIVCTWSEAPE